MFIFSAKKFSKILNPFYMKKFYPFLHQTCHSLALKCTLSLLLCIAVFCPQKIWACHGSQIVGTPTYSYNAATDQTTITIDIDQTIWDGLGAETTTFTVAVLGCVKLIKL